MSAYILGFDFGTRSIGVALAHQEAYRLSESIEELPVLKAREGIPDWDRVAELLATWKPATVVVGLPFHSDGSELEITRRARKFGRRLEGRFGVAVAFVDETLSTRAAKEEARARGHRGDYAKQPVDSIAARLILSSWMSENP